VYFIQNRQTDTKILSVALLPSNLELVSYLFQNIVSIATKQTYTSVSFLPDMDKIEIEEK
jgi:hypothetical protein